MFARLHWNDQASKFIAPRRVYFIKPINESVVLQENTSAHSRSWSEESRKVNDNRKFITQMGGSCKASQIAGRGEHHFSRLLEHLITSCYQHD